MKQIVIAIFTILSLRSCVGEQYPVQVTVTTNILYVYACPYITCEIVGGVELGERPYVVGDDVNGFTSIKYFGMVRYVASRGVSHDNP